MTAPPVKTLLQIQLLHELADIVIALVDDYTIVDDEVREKVRQLRELDK